MYIYTQKTKKSFQPNKTVASQGRSTRGIRGYSILHKFLNPRKF